jgi:TolB-like protein/DNA-binding SARP family transcriptional activator/tetratricopeptide (TPR) repeat protein
MVRLRVLGGFALEGASGAAAPTLPKRRAQAALAVLAVCGDLGCTRERLLALLWPESDEASARHGLRDALHAIRRALGPEAVPSSGSHLRLDSSVVSSDARSFTEALGSGRPADAVGGYGGPLLDGFHVDDAPEFERWLDGERTRMAREYGEALKQLATAAERAGAWGEAAEWWARGVEHDPLNSHLVLQQARVLATIGDRANAIKVVEGHARRLREEFDLEPDREIFATIERIRKGELPALQGGVPTFTLTPLTERRPTAEESPPQTAITTTVRRTPRWIPWAAGAAAIVLGATFGAVRFLKTRAPEASGPRTAVAVLPFRDLSADSSYAYFAGGLHDELLTQLAKVASLSVIGRTSVRGYEETSKPLRQIGQELAVGSIVEASVQVVGNRLRVAVQLLDPVTQAELWAERYDRTLDDAFAVQSDIARQIVAAVGATVTGSEAGAIAAVPTQNAEAYQFYLRGLEYQRRGFRRENLLLAQQLYQQALALDSGFALAHAAISHVHTTMWLLEFDRSATRLESAQREADVALRLAPGLPQAHLAAGARYRALGQSRAGLGQFNVRGDFRAALDQFNLGLQGAPNDPELWTSSGWVHCSLGNYDSALVAFDHARRLDPRDATLLETIGGTYGYFRRHRQAIEAYRHAFALAPELVHARLNAGWNYFNWKGQLDTLRAALQSLPLTGDPGGGGGPIGDLRLLLLLWERRPDSLLSLLPVIYPANDTAPVASLQRVEWTARAQSLRGDTAAARLYFDSVLVLLNDEGRVLLDERWRHSLRGFALAALGRRAEALREADWLERFDDYVENRCSRGTGWARAVIMAQLGETGKALGEIEQLFVRPGTFSLHELRLTPDFDPIRNDPRYLALLRKYANLGS